MFGDDGPTSLEREELRRLRKWKRPLRMERDILSKGCSLKAPLVQAQWTTPGSLGRVRLVEALEFMNANQAVFAVQMMARLVGVSRSGSARRPTGPLLMRR